MIFRFGIVVHVTRFLEALSAGTDPAEVKWVNFHPPFSEPSSFFLFFSLPSNIYWFSYIITKIHPQFQNPGSAPDTHACGAAFISL